MEKCQRSKGIAALVIAVVMGLVFAGCGDVKGKSFDNGNIEVFVPDGWKAFHGADVFDEYEEGYDPNSVSVGKGVESEMDLFSKPMAKIYYYGKGTIMEKPSKDWYEDCEEIKPMKLDNYTWTGFTGKSFGYPLAVLWAEDGYDQLQVTFTLENGNEKISLEDEDVQALLSRVKVKK